jgi:hypothetical protein
MASRMSAGYYRPSTSSAMSLAAVAMSRRLSGGGVKKVDTLNAL